MTQFHKGLRGLALGVGILALSLTSPASSAEFNWRMQSNLASGEPGFESVRENFVEAVERMSGGRVNIELFSVGALFPIQEGLEAVGAGIAEIGMMTGGYFAGKMGPIATLESGVPGAERDAIERHVFFYKRGFIDLAREAYATHNVYYLAPHISTQWDIISRRPVTSAADFDGLRVRSFGIEAMWYESMGASTVLLGGGEIYTALSTGVIDAARWGSPSVIQSIGLHEVAKHYIQPSPMPAPNNNFLINQQAWDSLPDDIKAIMEEAAKLASLDYIARGAELDARAMAEMEEAGVEVSRIPEEEWSAMEEKARELWSAYAENDDLSARAVSLMHEFLSDIGR
jgi:TRAP-type mannitol/chloroaromatic compound transport system substrate-binding protein